MVRSALPRVDAILQKRQHKRSTDLEEAERLRAEAQAVRIEYENFINNARLEASQVIEEASKRASLTTDEEQATVIKKLQKEAEEASGRVRDAKHKALTDLADHVETLATAIKDSVIDSTTTSKPRKTATTK